MSKSTVCKLLFVAVAVSLPIYGLAELATMLDVMRGA